MPTLNWIFETVEDRFHERGGDDLQRLPSRIQCPLCVAEFADAIELSWHISEAHPLERPVLLVGGSAVPSTAVYPVPIDRATIVCANTTGMRATCNGTPIRPDPVALADRLGSERRAVFHIELENERAADDAKVTSSYAIVTAVPEEEDLVAVDRAFARHLAVEAPTLSDVREFADAAGGYLSADRYTNGLAEYVLAILAKDGDPAAGGTLRFDAFQVKLQRSLAELTPHRARPIPQAVCGMAQLNINDVRSSHPTTGNQVLDGTMALLRAMATGDTKVTTPAIERTGVLAPVCPIDRDTHLVLSAFNDLFAHPERAGAATVSDYAARATDSTLSAFDRTKLHVIVAAHLLDAGESALAATHLVALAHDPLFGRWAQSALQEAPADDG